MIIHKKLSLYNTTGFFGLMLCLFFMYIPQHLFHLIFYDQFVQHYNGSDGNAIFVSVFILTLVFFLFLIDIMMPRFRRVASLPLSKYTRLFIYIIILIYLLIACVASIKFLSQYDISFRHNTRLRDTGIWVNVLFLLKSVVIFHVFYVFVLFLRGTRLTKTLRLMLFPAVTSVAVTMNASLTIPLVILGYMLVFLSQERLESLFFTNHMKSYSAAIPKYILFFGLCVGLFVFVVFFGIANKIGMNAALEKMTDYVQLYELAGIIFPRLSSSYSSALMLIDSHLFDYKVQIDVIVASIETFLNRLSILIPVFDYNIEGIRTVYRINYELLYVDPVLERAGASPGIIASVLYFPFFPLNIIVFSIYLVFIVRMFNKYIPMKSGELNILALLFVAYFILPFLESPISYFMIIDPAVIHMFMFVAGLIFIGKHPYGVRS